MSTRTTLLWIYFWGGFTIIMANTGTDWGLVATWITLTFVVIGTFYSIGRYYYRKWTLKNPIEVYYEQNPAEITHSYTSKVSRERQSCQITLRAKAETNIQFIRLNFQDGINKPQITALWDWQHGHMNKADYITARSLPDGKWFWEYDSPLQRRKDKRITINIEYIADKPYQGKLDVAVTSNETDKELCLDFAITENSGNEKET
ncbi:hypothetical protein ACFLS8_04170 [Chloroflexota bacterium]